MDNILKTNISFGGFYHSIHDMNIDHRVEIELDMIDLETNIKEWKAVDPEVDYKETYKSYIADYCSELSGYISDEYEIDIDFKNLSLYSPREYNFETDTIDCEVDKDKANKLNAYFLNDQDFIEYLNERTKSYDGYRSFYTFEQAKNNKDDMLIRYVLEYICSDFNDDLELNDFEITLNPGVEYA